MLNIPSAAKNNVIIVAFRGINDKCENIRRRHNKVKQSYEFYGLHSKISSVSSPNVNTKYKIYDEIFV